MLDWFYLDGYYIPLSLDGSYISKLDVYVASDSMYDSTIISDMELLYTRQITHKPMYLEVYGIGYHIMKHAFKPL